MPVGEMLRRTSSAELTEWMAYEQMTGPLGPARTDILFAQLCAVVANAGRDKKSKKARPKDFLPRWDRGRGESQTWQQQKSMAQLLNAAFGGTVNGREQDRQTQGPRYKATTRDGLAVVLDTRNGTTEWTGLDRDQAAEIAAELNRMTTT